MARSSVTATVGVAGGTAAAAVAWTPLFGWSAIALPAACAVLGPWALTMWSIRRGWTPKRFWATSAAALLGCAIYVVFLSTTLAGIPTLGTVSALASGAWNGFQQLLTSPAPTYPEPETMFIPFAAIWLATTCAAWLTARKNRPLLALFAVLASWLCGAVLSVGVGGVNTLAAAGVAISVLVVLTSASRSSGSLPPSRQALVVATLTGAVVVATTGLASTDRPWDPRSMIEPTVDQTSVVDPLQQVARWNDPEHHGDVAVTARFDGGAEALTLAVLNSYDGKSWSVADGYKRAGQQLPQRPASWPKATATSAEVNVERMDGANWVPVIDRPTEISVGDWLVEPNTGMLRRLESAGNAPYSFTVTGSQPNQAVASADGQTTTDGGNQVEAIVPANTPPTLTEMANQAVGESNTPTERAQALAEWFKTEYGNDPAAASGSSLGQVRAFLEDRRVANSAGFVTAYATLARTVGLASRVTIQLQPGDPAATMTGADVKPVAQVWLGSGIGWQSFDPVPAPGDIPTPQSEPAAEPNTADVPQPLPPAPEVCEGCYEAPPQTAPLWLLLLAGLGGALVIGGIAYAATITFLKSRRQRRRLTSGPRASVRGAFAEAVDHYIDADLLVLTADLTETETARRLEPDTGLDALAHLADAAAFSANEATAEEITYAWMLSDSARNTLSATLTARQRLRQRISSRSLLIRRNLLRTSAVPESTRTRATAEENAKQS